MKLRALVIDDEPLAHDVIKTYAEDIPFLDIVGHCYLATEAISFLNENHVDLLFLDIQMPKLKGNEFLRTLTKKPAVIITSAYEEYALESFELDATDYLLKPFRFDRFLKAVNKVHDHIQLKNEQLHENEANEEGNHEESTSSYLMLKVDKRQIHIDSRQINYLESYGNYVKVWIDTAYHLTPRTLSSFEEQLNNKEFLRVHKSFIVQKASINYIEGNRIVLKNKSEIPIGKSYKQQFKEGLF
ncbi:LytTR family DNA-binding domain-containing protein [Marivirga atlantica]|jgi:DNA-binding LytR/AlgR family response regulator|uniref:Response regulator transcription factor n=1 Tax=Marivirga atlantica TaxID=1548457 RepID=A0A937DF46_9BACT|nr:LytTR family DNA-binding domain-containing protein [Marivirga atlantica]MBL0765857.1 response regulator transcription factor [Marivirga atlantica]